MPGELASDENMPEPIVNFKIKTYNIILDILITQIYERFNENLTLLYKDISLFQRKRLKEVEQLSSSLPLDTFYAFGSIYDKFILADVLRKEYIQFLMHTLVLKTCYNFSKNYMKMIFYITKLKNK